MCYLLVVQIQCHSMSDEVLRAGLKAKFLIDGFHAILVQIDAFDRIETKTCKSDRVRGSFTLLSSWVIIPPVLEEFKELLCTPFLE